MVTVNWPKWSKIVAPAFLPLVQNQDRIIILYGGRGSTKSSFVVRLLIYRCLHEKYFRLILSRGAYNDIKDSMYQDILDTVFTMQLQDLFTFKLQPLEIICNYNNNKFIARGRDNAKKLKSVKDPTGVWYEEDIPTEDEYITISSGVRTKKASFLQEIFSINPEIEGNFQDNWFWKRFFSHRTEISFSDKTTIKIPKINKSGAQYFKDVDINYTVHHSTWRDNPWATDIFIAQMMKLKEENAYYYTIYDLGLWGNKQLGGRFYKNFDMGRHTYNYTYNPNLPLHISFDFNTNPYMTLLVCQVEGKGVYVIDEIAMADPKNKVKDTCWEFKRKYNTHIGGLFVYGDPAGKAEDVGREKGFNHFSTIRAELDKFHPSFRVAASHPPIKTRGDFINTVFETNFDGWSFFLFEKSTYLKNDFLFGKEDHEGGKFKEKIKGANGVPYEKHHHFSDAWDYMICELCKESFSRYQHGDVTEHRRPMGRNIMNEAHRL